MAIYLVSGTPGRDAVYDLDARPPVQRVAAYLARVDGWPDIDACHTDGDVLAVLSSDHLAELRRNAEHHAEIERDGGRYVLVSFQRWDDITGDYVPL